MKKMNIIGVVGLAFLLFLGACSKDQQLGASTNQQAVSLPAEATTGSLTGKLNPQPLSATITISNGQGTFTTTMRSDGVFYFSNIPAGTYQLRVDFTYESRFGMQNAYRIIDGVKVSGGVVTDMGDVLLQFIN